MALHAMETECSWHIMFCLAMGTLFEDIFFNEAFSTSILIYIQMGHRHQCSII